MSTYSCAISVIKSLDSFFKLVKLFVLTLCLTSPSNILNNIFCSSGDNCNLIFCAKNENLIPTWLENPCASAFNFLKSLGIL